jgi:hypothetical protein
MPMRPTWRPWSGSSAASQPAWSEEAPGRPALGLLTTDMLGKPLVLACDPLVSPVRFVAVPLLDLLDSVSALAREVEKAEWTPTHG